MENEILQQTLVAISEQLARNNSVNFKDYANIIGIIILPILFILARGYWTQLIEKINMNEKNHGEKLDTIFDKLDKVKSIPECDASHKNHDEKHKLEKEFILNNLDDIKKDVNGIGKKIAEHVKEGH